MLLSLLRPQHSNMGAGVQTLTSSAHTPRHQARRQQLLLEVPKRQFLEKQLGTLPSRSENNVAYSCVAHE